MIALLRAINVAGHNIVPMGDLRAMFEALGFSSVKTLLQTGNVYFSGKATEPQLEAALKKHTGVETDFILRADSEFDGIVAKNPFPGVAADEPGKLVVMFLKDAPKAAGVKRLEAAIKGRETVRPVGTQLYVHYPDGIGRSKLTIKLIEKHLDAKGTGRNWNTVLKIARLAET
ncbi:MAG: DUF1697 domain-containing protein [Planctomycetes bacterium]|nr:DUF1697 domain-containing protein [Planctomycetota bacterium]